MKIVKRKVDDLIFAEYNPRQMTEHQVKSLTDSIKRFGLVDPIIVNKHPDRTDIVVGGHMRLRIAKQLGIAEVPTIEVNEPLDRERELNIRLNQNTGQWDFELLANNFEVDDLLDWGFDAGDLNFEVEPAGGLTDDDAVPEVKESICKSGDLWLLGDHRLLCGDCTVKEDVERLMGGGRPCLMVTDPPYGVEFDTEWRKNAASEEDRHKYKATGKVAGDERADWHEAWALAPCKVAYIWHSALHANEVQESLLVEGFEIRSQIIWRKSHFAMSRGHYHWQHEPCFYAVRKGAEAGWIGDRKQTTIWDILPIHAYASTEDHTGHGTQKPIECMEHPIRNHSGDVYDPFLGSGTTLIACEKLGRRCYGIEIDPHYCTVILQRWADFTGSDPVREDGAKFSELVSH